MVTTPQELAGLVVRKALKLLHSREIPIKTIVENMSHIELPNGERIQPFGPSHLDSLADLIGNARIIRMPIQPKISQLADEGRIEEIFVPEFESLARALLAEE